jgi:hypothetical protein
MFVERLFLQNAVEAWMRHHQMTYSLLERLSDEQFHAEVLKPDLTSFAKHFEEIATVQEAYAQAFYTGKLDFSQLPRDCEYTGTFSKEELKVRLEKADQAVQAGVDTCPPDRVIDIFGNICSRVDLVQTMLHHELFHHGMFSVYAHEMKFDLPKDWRDFWWIPVSYGG